MNKKLYVITNSHLDPIWLWNRSSGRSSWLNTMQTVTKIMSEEPDIKFTCSAAALYRWVEQTDPVLFRKIAALVEAGRWEITGGWEVQSDAIISRPETILRQAFCAKEYFFQRFGVDINIAYNVDAFGHSAGLPKLLRANGFTHYVFNRSHTTPGVFNWQADDGSAVTALHILTAYGTGNLGEKALNDKLQEHLNSPLEHQTFFFGVGDHGGGISRQQLAWLRKAQEKYDIEFSTLREYFEIIKDQPKETVTGELGPVFRGCYSNCHEVKRKIARATRRMITAEKLSAMDEELNESWQELCYHHFHDILPGTSIREAYQRDVFPGLGSVEHTADTIIDRQLFRRAAKFDTRYMTDGGIYVWNPHPFTHKTIVSFIGFADPNSKGVLFNALKDAQGNELPLQLLPTPSAYGPCGVPWGKITAVVELPAMGETTFALSHSDKEYPLLGFESQYKLLKKLDFELYFDHSRTWGFGLDKFDILKGKPELLRTEEYLDGPVCSILRSHWKYNTSTIIVDLCRYKDIPETGVQIKLDWHETECALKLIINHNLSKTEFYTGSGASIVQRLEKSHYQRIESRRMWVNGNNQCCYPETGEISMIDWCAAMSDSETLAVYAPDLHSCDHCNNQLRITLLRPVLHADHAPFIASKEDHWMDLGYSERKLWIAEMDDVPVENLPGLANQRLNNGEVCETTIHEASDQNWLIPELKLSLDSKQVVLQAYRINESGDFEIHLMNYGDAVKVNLPAIGEIKLPARALRIISWN